MQNKLFLFVLFFSFAASGMTKETKPEQELVKMRLILGLNKNIIAADALFSHVTSLILEHPEISNELKKKLQVINQIEEKQ